MQIFAVDFLTQTTAFFVVWHIFVVMEIASRRINVTTLARPERIS